jgi:hypothetical protein
MKDAPHRRWRVRCVRKTQFDAHEICRRLPIPVTNPIGQVEATTLATIEIFTRPSLLLRVRERL